MGFVVCAELRADLRGVLFLVLEECPIREDRVDFGRRGGLTG